MNEPRPPRSIVPASRYEIAQHVEQHPCPDTGDDAITRVCPCGRTRSICCPVCDEPVFAVPMTHDYCEHLAELCPEVSSR